MLYLLCREVWGMEWISVSRLRAKAHLQQIMFHQRITCIILQTHHHQHRKPFHRTHLKIPTPFSSTSPLQVPVPFLSQNPKSHTFVPHLLQNFLPLHTRLTKCRPQPPLPMRRESLNLKSTLSRI
ncbi:hypothetical protein BC829DRAFT_394522 [Chytridium lagenaria]|nr:hypothetical protein BC829DRAFT_394522 [Chytridium lagenaria]